MEFDKIAPYLEDPLVLVGFFLLLFFGLGRALLKAGIIPVLTKSAGYRIIRNLLLYGFLLGLAIVAVAFALKYRELSEQEQRAAVRLLHQELEGNIAVAGELKKNTETILGATNVVSSVLRTPNIKVLAALFPVENTDAAAVVPPSVELARLQLDAAKQGGLLDDSDEIRKFREAADAITGTLVRTKTTIASLADSDRTRYVIQDGAWRANLPILRKVNIVDASRMQALYQDLANLRTNYGVVVGHCIEYLGAIDEFLSDTDSEITPSELAKVLAAERVFFSTTTAYVKDIEVKTKAVADAQAELAALLGTADAFGTPGDSLLALPRYASR
jgi:hypothetical protein